MAIGLTRQPFNAKKARGTGFTNLQTILQANAANRLGKAVGAGVQQTAQQARTGIQQAQQQFQQQSEQNRLDTEANRQQIGSVLSRFGAPQAQTQPIQPTQPVSTGPMAVTQPIQPRPRPEAGQLSSQPAGEMTPVSVQPEPSPEQSIPQEGYVSPEEMQAFSRFRTGTYAGPQTLENVGALRGQALEAEQLGQGIGTTGGRLGLLQRFAAKPGSQYAAGQQRLDQLLLGGASPELKQARRQALGLTGEASKAQSAAEAMAGEFGERARTFGEETLGRIKETQDPISQALERRVAGAEIAEKRRAQTYTDIKDLLTGRGIQSITDPVTGEVIRKGGDTPGDESAARKQALTLAAEQGLLSSEDIDKIGELNRLIQTPIERMMAQRATTGGGGLLGYGGAEKGQTFEYAATPTTSSLKLNQVLRDYLSGEEAKNISRGGIATASERQRLNQLAKLGGGLEEFGQPSQAYQRGYAGFDLGKARRTVEEDIARLRNEKLEMPEYIEEVPLQEKLRRTFLPTAEEIYMDQSADIDKVLSEGTKVSPGALARLAYNPVRAVQSAYAQPFLTGADAASRVVGGDGDIIDRLGALNELGTAPVTGIVKGGTGLRDSLEGIDEATKASLARKAGLGQALENINKIESIINKPVVTAASGFQKIGDVISRIPVVGGAVGGAIRSIGGIFCYAEGTPIKMADGDWKEVQDIKVGEKCFLGGEVLGTGEVKAEYVYEYKDQIVNGEHCVFEDGKFIRVKDSPLSEKYKNTLDIRLIPIVNKNHLLCTETHVGSDYNEIDDGHKLTEPQRLQKLNDNKDLLQLVDQYDKMMFKNDKKI